MDKYLLPKVYAKHHERRNNYHRNKRKLPIQNKKCNDYTDYIRKCPKQVNNTPCDHLTKSCDIAYHSCHNVAYRRLVVV